MSDPKYLSLVINNEVVDLGDPAELGFKISYALEEPENFMSKQGTEPQNISVPGSKNNDKIFNTFHNPQVEDAGPGSVLSGTTGIVTSLNASGIFSSGWILGDTFEVTGGSPDALGTITGVGVGGVVTSYVITYGGDGYTPASIYACTALTSTGIGFSIKVVTVGASLGSAGGSFRDLMPCIFNVNGTNPILLGYAQLDAASITDKPDSYDFTIYGANGLWVTDLQNVTMWDCVNPNSHNFDVTTIEASWSGFNSDEDHDYVYAPVRYRQPFDGTTMGWQGDNAVNIYHLRPSISLYWLIYRAFNQIGYTLSSQFFATDYFQRLVLPWVWGDFYDINSQLVQGICFKAAGRLPDFALVPPPATASQIPFWSGGTLAFHVGVAGGSSWYGDTFGGGWNGALYSGGVASIDNGIEYNTQVGTAEVAVGGTGYAPGDTFVIVGSFGTASTGTVATVSGGGAVLTFTVTAGGADSEGYAAGNICATSNLIGVGVGLTVLILTNSHFQPGLNGTAQGQSAGLNYVFTGSGSSPITPGGVDNFYMDVSSPPDGYDNFLLYSFINATGTMQYDFVPPPSLVGTMTNVSLNFLFTLYATINLGGFEEALIGIECLHDKGSGRHVLTCQSIMPNGKQVVGGTTPFYPNGSANPTNPTVCTFIVPNCNPNDILKFRVVILTKATSPGVGGGGFGIFSGGYLNNNPTVIGVPSYAYNPVTQQFGFITPNSIWSPLRSNLTLTGFLIQLGNSVNLKNYDAFRNFNILDVLAGTIDLFNMEVQTDNVNRVVTIEPMFETVLPTSETADGYFSLTRILDYTQKRDLNKGKGSRMQLFNGTERQLDLTFKLDSNDGAQNIWALRYKGIYLNNRTYTGGNTPNNMSIDPGIIAGIPGCARYVLPNRFAKGNRQMANRFFSAAMHVTFPQWVDIQGTSSPATQMICIFPEGSNSSDAYAQAFAPKLAWYAGNGRAVADTGGWVWLGDPAHPIAPASAVTYNLPQMLAVNYNATGASDPVLSYSDENINGVKVSGLMSQFYLRRFAIMRNGQLLTTYLRLTLNDICNWTHRECIMIDNSLYALIQIDGFDPLTDDTTPCTLWRVVNPMQVDLDNCYPSTTSIITQPMTLPNSFDLRYAQLLVYSTDVPQIG